jgi:hypothetical protein
MTMAKVRIIHPGGPARNTAVYVGEQLLPVTRIELVIDPVSNAYVGARLTILDIELDIIADIDDLELLRVPQPKDGTGDLQMPAGYYKGRPPADKPVITDWPAHATHEEHGD